jgi:hypothetical protein
VGSSGMGFFRGRRHDFFSKGVGGQPENVLTNLV